MCSDGSVNPTGNPGNLLTGVLTPDVEALPKASLPLSAVEEIKGKYGELKTKLSLTGKDANSTLHVTPDALYLSGNTPTGATDEPGKVTVAGPQGALDITVASASGEDTEEPFSPQLFDNWSFSLSWLPLLSKGEFDEPAKLVDFEVAVTGTAATMVKHYVHSPSRSGTLAGINIGCLIEAGGGTILTTIYSCLSAYRSGGSQSFKSALLSALGPSSVDLIKNLTTCLS